MSEFSSPSFDIFSTENNNNNNCIICYYNKGGIICNEGVLVSEAGAGAGASAADDVNVHINDASMNRIEDSNRYKTTTTLLHFHLLLIRPMLTQLLLQQQPLGRFRVKLRFFERFNRGARVTRVTMPTARYLATRKILKIFLKIEIENYHFSMTMGMYRIGPPWMSICLIQTYKTKYIYWYA
jgi:hypothetical protein